MQFNQTNNNQGDVNNLIILNPEKMEEVVTQEEMSKIIEDVDKMVSGGQPPFGDKQP